MVRGIAILPIVFLIFIIIIGVFAWGGLFNELTSTSSANPELNDSYTMVKNGASIFDLLISPIPIILTLIVVAMIGLVGIAIVRRSRM